MLNPTLSIFFKKNKFKNFWILCFATFFVLINFNCDKKDKITDVELINFCEDLETSIMMGDPSVFNNALYETGLQKRVFEGFKPGSTLRYVFNETLKNQFRIGDDILNTVWNGDYIFEVTKIYHDKNKTPTAVFRLFNGVSFNYIEFQFEKILGKILISEGYYFDLGQKLSELLRDLIFLEIGFDKEKGKDPFIKKYFKDGIEFLEKSRNQIALGNYEKALDDFDYMDKRLLEKPFFITQRLKILFHFNEEKAYEYLGQYDSLFPDKKRFNTFNSVRLKMFNGDVEATRKAIHNLSKIVGSDAVLDFYEAHALLNNGDFDKAVFYFEKFIKQKPGLSCGYIGKSISLISKKDFEKATFCLKDIINKFETNFEGLENSLSEFPEFLSSDEYQLWKKGLGTI